MKYYVYILYSSKLDKYYVGCSSNVDIRLRQHNHISPFRNWTKAGAPWELLLKIECLNKKHALQIERAIKRNKSRKYTENLLKYPEIMEKLIQNFS